MRRIWTNFNGSTRSNGCIRGMELGRRFGSTHISHKALWRPCAYINGKFIDVNEHGSGFPVVNPANGKILGHVPRMRQSDAENASKISFEAWQSWKNTTAKERSKVLQKMTQLMEKYKKDLATIITLEAGKPLPEAIAEVNYALSFFEYYSEEAKRVFGEVLQPPVHGRRLLALKQPVGPAALITPWNFPCAMVTRKVGPALAAGCTVVLKPSEETPFSALAICAIAEEAGLPPGVLNCITVDRSEVMEVGTSLCHDPLIRKLSFTGSTVVGKWLMRECSETVKKVSCIQGSLSMIDSIIF